MSGHKRFIGMPAVVYGVAPNPPNYYTQSDEHQPRNTSTTGEVTLEDLKRTVRQVAQAPRHRCRTCGQVL